MPVTVYARHVNLIIRRQNIYILNFQEKTVLNHQSFRVIKPEIRIIGVDDGAFIPHVEGQVPVVGVVFRGGYWLDGVIHTWVSVDGLDATDKLSSMIVGSPHYKQLRVIMLNGITFAGFNIVNIKALNSATKLPVITVTREKPDLEKIHAALQHLKHSEKRWKIILDAGEPTEVATRNMKAKVYMQTAGVSIGDAQKILRLTSTRSHIPEALRVAHIIASGISDLKPCI
jgi:endonuclease V-like protein UPF0215 family